jgi:hypothetical protein
MDLRAFCRVGEEVAPLAPHRPGRAPTQASGSSHERFVPSGVAVNDPGRWQRVTVKEHIEVAP